MARLGLAALLGVVVLGLVAAPGRAEERNADAGLARQVLDLAGVRVGLCVHLGCGREASAGLTAELAGESRLLVHGLALDDASLARARKAVEARGLMGRAMVEKVPVSPLPYLRDLANLVVIEDFDALAKQGLTMDEVLRVTRPNGVVCVLKDGRWTKTVKPRPKEMDEWTHPYHGADGNLVSTDTVVGFPVGYRWLDGIPCNVTGFAATRAWVIADGRLFALGINERENLGRARGGYELYLAARDAFNGLPLWKINCGGRDDGTGIMWENAGALVADEHRAYAVQDGKLIAADADTGRIVVNFATKYPAARLILLDGVLVAACWEEKVRPKGQWLWYPKADVGSVEAFDAATGKSKWAVPEAAFQLLASDGVVYLVTPPTAEKNESCVIALDLQTGRERWRVPHTKLGAEPDILLTTAGPGYLILTKSNEKLTCGLSAVDGRTLWQLKGSHNWTPVVDGLVWFGEKRDPMTGESRGRMPRWLNGHGCSFNALAGRFMVTGYGFVDLETIDPETRGLASVQFTGGRGACVEKWVPANGMFYTAQNNCKCVPGATYGFMAIGPNGDWPAAADFQTARPVEKGPAFGAVEAAAPAGGDWPTYRHDAERTGATQTLLPEKLKQLWKTQAARPPEGPLAPAWEAPLGSCVTAPVVAGGRVFLASTDAGQVVALDAVTGKEVWRTTLGGRIDTPPTIHRGLCLVGCHDGWVYALRAKDGSLAWRMRVAPRERRMVAFGEVESVWPAVGTVLVHEDVACVSAGRSSESDGGIAVVAFDPATGAQLWGRTIGPGALRMNDLLSLRDGSVAWRYVRLDEKTGDVTAPAAMPTLKDYGGGGGKLEGAMLDGTWTVVSNRRAGNAFTLGTLTADLLVWNETLVVSPVAAVSRENDAELWKVPFRRNPQVEAMALAGNVVLLAGRVKGPAGEASPGFLCALSVADGKKLTEFAFDVPPTYDGLAVANGRAYVSLQDGSVVCLGGAD